LLQLIGEFQRAWVFAPRRPSAQSIPCEADRWTRIGKSRLISAKTNGYQDSHSFFTGEAVALGSLVKQSADRGPRRIGKPQLAGACMRRFY
jgi:hypothetical protein